MIIIDKPPLDETYLEHFGKKGMKWGVRKKRPDEEQRKKIFQDRARKVLLGAAVVGGALAIGALMTKRGRIKATDAAVTNYVQQRQARAQAGKNPFGQLAQKFRDTKAASVPSPDQMIAEARMAGVRNRVEKAGNQRLADRSWRDAANFQRQARTMGPKPDAPSIEQIRQRLQDPNYVWQL